MESLKYLSYTISNDMICYQEIGQRIAMAKDVFNREREIFYGALEKELRKKLVKCFM